MNVTALALWILAAMALPAWLAWDPLLSYCTAAILLVVGVAIAIKRAPAQADWVEKIVLCGPVFMAMPMAVFGTEHFLDPVSIGGMVPSWIPAHIFWAYFVGACLILGGLSIVVQIRAGLSAALFGIMMLLFDVLLHIPNAAADPRNRFPWVIVFREMTFGLGALSFAAMHTEEWRAKGRHWLISVARVCIGGALIFYAVEQLLHPEFFPAIPLQRLTPTSIPGHLLWSYVTGVLYVPAGVCLILNKRARLAATWIGVWVLFITVVVYGPIMVQNGDIGGGLNPITDTLMYSGALLCLAGSLREEAAAKEIV
ncbi:MAG: hypothetical protein WB780_19845 [Candidatus Acidiferrales bacterium]